MAKYAIKEQTRILKRPYKAKKWRDARYDTKSIEGFEAKYRSHLSKKKNGLFKNKTEVTTSLLMQRWLLLF